MEFKNLLEVALLVEKKVVDETLSRIGICNKKDKILYPSCYLIERDGVYYLAHFKELFCLRENGYNNMSIEDINRKNSIAYCLHQWKMISVPENMITPHDSFIFVLKHSEKKDWSIVHKWKFRGNFNE